MANYNDLLTAINSVIKTNNRREITGLLLQNVLDTMVGSLGENYQLAGFATPTTNPHQPDQNVFYVASQAGVYTQFDNIVLGDGISFLMWKNGAWTSQTIANVTQSWVQQNFVSKEWFRKVFRVYDANDLEIVPNDMDSVADNIKAMVGLWTNQYLSALGMGRDGGGSTQTLAQLNDVQLGTLANGDALVYNAAIHKWENKQIQTGVDMSVVWAALAANTNEQINASHLATALSSYVTTANLSTILNDYATKAWAGQNFITVEWFDKLFQLYNGTEAVANKIAPNGALPVDQTQLNIEAMFGFWTKKYISALGQGDDGTSYTTLAQLNDVTLTNPTADQVLTYNGTHWVNRTLSLGSQTLVGLSDVAITTPSANQMLSYDVTTQKWVNAAIPATGVTSIATGTGLTGGTITTSGTISINSTYQTYISHGESAYGWGNHANAGYAAGTTRNFTAGGSSWTVYAPYTTDVDLDSYYLRLSGGTMTGHIYLSGVSTTSTDNTTQIIFGTASNQHIALSSNPSRLIINPSTSTSSGQVCLSVGNNNFDSYVAMNSGNFGIGTDNPTQKLYVNGNAYANNYLTSSGNGAYVQIGAIKLVYDSANNAIKVIHSNGGNASLYATGGVSALGAGQESGGGGNYLPLSGGTMTGSIDSAYYCLSYSSTNPYLELKGAGITTYVQNYQSSMYIGFGVSNSIKIDSDATLTTKNILVTNGGTGDSPYIEFRRGDNPDDYTDWRIIDSSGALCFRPKSLGENWSNRMWFNGDGTISAYGFQNVSDIRKKNVVKDIDLRLDQIAKAPAFEYYWFDQSIDHDLHVGTSAQYWQSVLPEVVTTAKDEMGTLSMQYGVAALISTITVARKVMTHEEKIALLETCVSALEKENGEQEMLINSLQEELSKFKAA